MSNELMKFGKYKGERIEEVIDEDTEYINWCLKNVNGFFLPEGMEPPILLGNSVGDEDLFLDSPEEDYFERWSDEDFGDSW